jgi:hypothetical protein
MYRVADILGSDGPGSQCKQQVVLHQQGTSSDAVPTATKNSLHGFFHHVQGRRVRSGRNLMDQSPIG